MNVSISARPADQDGERDWFELNVDVFVGDGSALTPKELAALLQSSGRYAEVRGKLFDVEALRLRRTLLSELNDRRRTGMAALVALHDEIHEAFGDVALPEEVAQRLRERLRNFGGIPNDRTWPTRRCNHVLRDYQRRGLDFSRLPAGSLQIRRRSRRRNGAREVATPWIAGANAPGLAAFR